MEAILAWIAATLAVIVTVQSIWVVTLCVKAHKRWKRAWMKKNKLHSVALVAAPAFLPVMWALCGVLFVEFVILTFALVNFYAGNKTVKTTAVPAAAPKEKREKVQQVVFAAPVAARNVVEPTAEDVAAVAAIAKDVISVDEARVAISDEVAARFIKTEKSEVAAAGENKCIINIDTISENFENGDVVNLDALKAKKIVKSNVNSVKILARGTLNKKLTVEANSFSIDAVKMIILTGGTAIKKA